MHVASGSKVWAHGAYEGRLRAILVEYKHGKKLVFAPILGALLSSPLRAAVGEAREGAPALVVTAPSRAERVRERGYRHVDLLVRRALRQMRREMKREAGLSAARCHCVAAALVSADNHRGGGESLLRDADGTGARYLINAPEREEASAEGRGELCPYLVVGALRGTPGRTGQVGLRSAQRARNAALVRVPRHMQGRLRGREVVLVDDIVTTGATLDAAAAALTAVGAKVVAHVALCVVERRDHSDVQ